METEARDTSTFGGMDSSLQAQRQDFYAESAAKIEDLRQRIAQLAGRGTIVGEQSYAFDDVQRRIAGFKEYVRNAASYLTTHDQKIYAQGVQALQDDLLEMREKLKPRQKFSFKKKNASALSVNDISDSHRPGYYPNSSAGSSVAPTPAREPSPSPSFQVDDDLVGDLPGLLVKRSQEWQPSETSNSSRSKGIQIANHENEHMRQPSTTKYGVVQCTLTELDKCVLDMSLHRDDATPFATLSAEDIKESVVICGHVDGAAHLTKIRNSVIVVQCRQFRLHESKNVDVYLHCSSEPIIEDCSDIRVAPLPKCYMRAQDHSIQNLYDRVNDFKWLKAEPSPNWSVLEESRRLPQQFWTESVSGKVDQSVEEILAEARVASE